MALVHSFFLSCGRLKYLCPHLPVRLSSAQASWGHRPDRDALSHWNRTLHEDSPRGRGSTIPSGNPSLAFCRGGIAYTHPRRLDSSVKLRGRVELAATGGDRPTAKGTRCGYARNPERFTHARPKHPPQPTAVWINPLILAIATEGNLH